MRPVRSIAKRSTGRFPRHPAERGPGTGTAKSVRRDERRFGTRISSVGGVGAAGRRGAGLHAIRGRMAREDGRSGQAEDGELSADDFGFVVEIEGARPTGGAEPFAQPGVSG